MNRMKYRVLAILLAAVTILSSLGGLPAFASGPASETAVLEEAAEMQETEAVMQEDEPEEKVPAETKQEEKKEKEKEPAGEKKEEKEKAATKKETASEKETRTGEDHEVKETAPETEKQDRKDAALSRTEGKEEPEETVHVKENEKVQETETGKEAVQEKPVRETESVTDDTKTAANTAEETETESPEETKPLSIFPEIKDTSVLKGLDFSSMRLIVAADRKAIVDEEHVLSSYDGIYLLQYESVSETKKAYAWYLDHADMVDVDITFSAAEGTDTSDTAAEMTEDDNPIAQLEDAMKDKDRPAGRKLIALIDTGVPASPNVTSRISMLGDAAGDDNGHGSRMLQHILSVDNTAQVLSIKALDENAQGTASSVYAALQYAASMNVKVIALPMSAYSKAENAIVKDAIQEAVSKGILVVGASGNDGKNVKYFIPGNVDEAIIVGACGTDGIRIPKCNFGSTVDYLVEAGTTSEAAVKLAAWLGAHADAASYAADIDTVIDRYGLIHTADDEGQGLDTGAPEGDGTFSADASVKLTSSEYLRKIYYNHIGAAFKVNYKGTTYQGVCAHDLIPAIPSKGSNLTIDYHKTITVKDKGSWYYTYAKIIYNAYYKESQYEKIFDKYPTHRRNSDLTKKDSRIYYTGLAMSYAQGHVYKDKSSIKNMIYNSNYGYDIKGDGAGLGKKVYNWVKNNGIDLAPNITIDIIWAYPSSHSRQPVIAFDVIKTSVASLLKTTVSEEGTAMNVVPSGAVYTIYSDEACQTKVVSLTVEDDGKSEEIPSSYFSSGKTYYAKETKGPTADPPEGYEWVTDTQVHSFSWDLKDDLELKYTNTLRKLPPPPPDEAPVGIRKVVKAGCEDFVKGNNQYSLAGAVYGVWTNASCSGEPVSRATTSASGLANFGKYFPIGSTVYIREISPSAGYEADPQIHSVTIKEESASNMVNNRAKSEEIPASGTLELRKKSAAAGDPNTRFDGAVFKVSFYPNGSWSGTVARNWYFVTKDNMFRYDAAYLAPGYTSDALYKDASGKAGLPAGTLTVTEMKAPEGYVRWSGSLKCAMAYDASTRTVSPKWTGSSYLETGSVTSFKNTPAFGGVQFSKVDADTKAPLKGAVIAIYNCSGKDVLINEGGTYKTVADKALAATVTTDEKGIAKTVANLFGTGRYYAVEQTPPFGYIRNTAWKKEFSITSADNGMLVDATDDPLEDTRITLHTLAQSDDLDEASLYEEAEDGKRTFKDIRITDTLSYENLPEGCYLIRGILMDKKTGKAFQTPEGKTFTAYTVLEAKKTTGTALVTFVITSEDLAAFDKKDGSNTLEGASLVVFERLYSLKKEETDEAADKPEDFAKEEREMAIHEDIKDAAQDIRFPDLQTHANDGKGEKKADQDHSITELGQHEVLASEEMVITDRVTYKNLHGDTEYVITGTLHYKDGSVVKDDSGKEITASETIHTSGKYDDSISGHVDLTFGPFSGLNLAGSTIIAFETVSRDGKEVMVHANIEDAPQTLYVPAIRTSATGTGSTADMHEAQAKEDGGITDTLSYENLKPGQEYTVKGRLVYRDDYPEEGIKAGDPVIINGTEITAERTFTADGRVEVPVAEPEDVIPAGPENPSGEAADPAESEAPESETEETEDFSDLTETDESELYEDGDISDVEDLNDYSDLEDEEDPGEDESESEEESEDGSETESEAGNGSTNEGSGQDTGKDPADGPQTQVTDPGIDLQEAEKELSRTGKYDGVSGSIVITFSFDTTALQGKNVVVFERLYTVADEENDGKETADAEAIKQVPGTTEENTDITESTEVDETKTVPGKLVAVHEDLSDDFQTVNIPSMGTSAADAGTGTHETQAAVETVITDAVKVTDLQTGKPYLLNGILMNKASGDPLIAGGQEVTAIREFSYEDIKDQEDTIVSEDGKYFSGTVFMDFTFDSSALLGETVVVFEKLYRENIPVAAHADLTDEDQSVDIVDIRTTASGEKTGTHEAQADQKTTLCDSVSLYNLRADEEYRLKTIIMDRHTGSEITQNGKSIVSETTFSYEDLKDDTRCSLHEDGQHYDAVIDLEAVLDTTGLPGHTLVFFEKLYHGEAEIASHEDLTDEGQSIDILDIRTQAADKTTGIHEGQAGKKTVVTDRVSLTHLLTGKTYKVSGTLMNRKTGKAMIADGKPVIAEKTFTYEDLKDAKETKLSEDGKHFDGEITLEFPIDSSTLAGSTVVAFEKLYRDDIELAVHEDLEDEDQSVHFIDLKTLAKDKKSGTQTMTLSEHAVITDTVTYTGLISGKKYTISGKIMDKATGKAVKATCRPVTFTAKDGKTPAGSQVNGQVKVTFELDTTILQEKELVVFETLKDADGKVIALHEDLEDEKQTVTVPKKEEEKTPRQTAARKGSSYPDEEVPVEKSTPVRSRNAVKTGAIFHALLWGSMLAISGFVIAAILIRRRRKQG